MPEPQKFYRQERAPLLFVHEAGWASESVRTSSENVVSTGVRIPDHPTHSESLYQLRYSGHP